ncbi:hypothetical protein HN832_03535 [archaeon]|mgnify:CR=1 FL=1|jgi:hypothetical protein|nr:hypothetical protein [archaeon]MBT4373531.1 hypothetical protein [archaeon]MBT4531979.1 hypothetical protein [archaeon]MBT7001646.1 hypothetical protein [archaeon]MBT7282462.1 hypothetical protein [archaeon]
MEKTIKKKLEMEFANTLLIITASSFGAVFGVVLSRNNPINLPWYASALGLTFAGAIIFKIVTIIEQN